MKRERARVYGLLAEFAEPDSLVRAIQRAREEGYRLFEAYTPYPVKEVSKAIGYRRSWVALIVLLGGIAGGVGGFFMEYYAAVISYPINIGGRPLNSWPMFIPITFELTVLIGALAGAFGMLALNGLPQPFHPLFQIERFRLATQSRFFLCIEARDPKFDLQETRLFLETLQPREVSDVRT
jgi:hypothetical protein